MLNIKLKDLCYATWTWFSNSWVGGVEYIIQKADKGFYRVMNGSDWEHLTNYTYDFVGTLDECNAYIEKRRVEYLENLY